MAVPCTGISHPKVVPNGIMPFVPSVGVILKGYPLHIVVLISLTYPPGFTNTVNVNAAPSQDPFVPVGIMV